MVGMVVMSIRGYSPANTIKIAMAANSISRLRLTKNGGAAINLLAERRKKPEKNRMVMIVDKGYTGKVAECHRGFRGYTAVLSAQWMGRLWAYSIT